MVTTIETDRLRVERLHDEDAPFILELLTDPAFIEHIGDKGVRDLEGARHYIQSGPAASHQAHGFGLDRVELRSTGESIGICGLLKREALEAADIGFAFLPQFRSKGYAFEAARAVLEDAFERLGLERVLAITSPTNQRSIRLLERLGFTFESERTLEAGEPPVKLFTRRHEA